MNNIRKKKSPEQFHMFVTFFAITGIRPDLRTKFLRTVFQHSFEIYSYIVPYF